VSGFGAAGWCRFPWETGVAAWAEAAHRVALGVTAEKAMQDRFLRHGGTWFVGVDALPNEADGSVGGVALKGPWEALVQVPEVWHRAQLSVVHPGYPGRDAGESEAGHRFRRERDAAHLDGLLAEGEGKRRFLREPHAFVLGLPLTEMNEETSPFVVWEGSHLLIGRAFAAAFAGIADVTVMDVTEVYQAARREVFETCPRRVVTAGPGEAILCHRMAIHGTAPWGQAAGPEGGRMVAWFRPLLRDAGAWLGEFAPGGR
jgi:hypothetical protein